MPASNTCNTHAVDIRIAHVNGLSGFVVIKGIKGIEGIELVAPNSDIDTDLSNPPLYGHETKEKQETKHR